MNIVQKYAPNKLFLLDLIDQERLAECLGILLERYDEDGLYDTPRRHGRIGRLLLKMSLQSVYGSAWKDIYSYKHIITKPRKLVFETQLPRYIYSYLNYYGNAVRIYQILENSGIQHPMRFLEPCMRMCSETPRRWLTICRKFFQHQGQIIQGLQNDIPPDTIIQTYLR